MGTSTNFDSMIISAEMCKMILKYFSYCLIVILVVFIFILIKKKKEYQESIMYVYYAIKIVAYGLSVVFVFCWDYENGCLTKFHMSDMTIAAFFVGFFGIAELLSILISTINEWINNHVNDKK